jgi:hypothetical protein
VDEARRVLARLERIDALDRERALPEVLLRELWALLDEADAWVHAERALPKAALEAVVRYRQTLEGTSRTLVA